MDWKTGEGDGGGGGEWGMGGRAGSFFCHLLQLEGLEREAVLFLSGFTPFVFESVLQISVKHLSVEWNVTGDVAVVQDRVWPKGRDCWWTEV